MPFVNELIPQRISIAIVFARSMPSTSLEASMRASGRLTASRIPTSAG